MELLRRRYIRGVVIVLFALISAFMLFLFYSAQELKHKSELARSSQVLSVFLEGLAKGISTGYFQWDDFYEALLSSNEEFIEENLRYIKSDFPYVKNVEIMERPPDISKEGLYYRVAENGDLFIYFNVWDSKVERVLEDKVVRLWIDLLPLLKDMKIYDYFVPDPDGSFTIEGIRFRCLIPRLKVSQVLIALALGILSALLVGFIILSHSERITRTKLLEKISMILEEKDPYTKNHSRNVMLISMVLADRLGLGELERRLLKEAALLHDIGKVGISDEILNKRGKLTPEEFEIVKRHSTIGFNILSDVNGAEELAKIIRHHHEREDGSGYPDGLRDGEIPLLSKIIAVADVFDALTSDRSYRPAMSPEEALKVMEDMPLDREIFNALRENYREILLRLNDKDTSHR